MGIAYTIQVFAQKKTNPSHAGIIMGMESVFAVLGGWLFLSEMLSFRGFLGCCLMLAGMLVSLVMFISIYVRLSVQVRSAAKRINALEGEVAVLRNRPIEESADFLKGADDKNLKVKSPFDEEA